MKILDEVVDDIRRGVYTGLTAPTAPKFAAIQGPHRWHEMTSKDFGPRHDFELENHGNLVVFDPISEAALQWCYAHLPEDCPRYSTRAFLIEAEHIKGVIQGARRDKLMTESDFVRAMEEAHQIAMQGEDQ